MSESFFSLLENASPDAELQGGKREERKSVQENDNTQSVRGGQSRGKCFLRGGGGGHTSDWGEGGGARFILSKV